MAAAYAVCEQPAMAFREKEMETTSVHLCLYLCYNYRFPQVDDDEFNAKVREVNSRGFFVFFFFLYSGLCLKLKSCLQMKRVQEEKRKMRKENKKSKANPFNWFKCCRIPKHTVKHNL